MNNVFKDEIRLETIIAGLTLIPVVEKHDMVQRKFHLNVTPTSLNALGNLIDIKKNTIQEQDIATNMPNVFTYDARPDLLTSIPNGWNQKRYGFMLEIHHIERSTINGHISGKKIEYIQGFTNYNGASMQFVSGENVTNLDPNMIFFVNSIICVRESKVPGTNRVAHTLMYKFNLMTNPMTNREEFVLDRDAFKVLRPIDVVSEFMLEEMLDPTIPTANFTNTVDSNLIIESKHDNKNNVNQVKNVLNAAYNARMNVDHLSSRSDVFSYMSSSLKEPTIADVEFLNILSEQLGRYSSTFNSSFIMTIDKFLNKKTRLLPDTIDTPTNLQNTQLVLFSNDTENLARADEESRLAHLTAEVIVPMLFNKNLTSFSFSISTELGFEEPIFYYISSASFIPIVDGNKEAIVFALKDQIETILLPQLTRGRNQIVNLMCYIDLLGQSRVAISINNGPLIPYAIPTYANSLYDSNIVRGQDKINNELASWKRAIDLAI